MSGARSYTIQDGALRSDLSQPELERALAAGAGPLWVDIDSRQDEEWRLLADVFHFHPLAIEDTRSPQGRVKIDDYADYLFMVLPETDLDTDTPDPYDLRFRNLNLFLGASYVVTVHAGPSPSVEEVRQRLQPGPDPLAAGPDRLAHHVLDTLVDRYFPLLDEIDTFVDELEEKILGGQREVLDSVFHMRRMLAQLRRRLAPAREVVATLANRPNPYLHPETQIYFRDVYDHVVRELDSVETYRDLLSGAMETYFSVISNRMNEVIKAISVIGTVVLPPTLIASIYGMNFHEMPLTAHPLGFWIALLLMAAVSVGFVAYLWWKRWI